MTRVLIWLLIFLVGFTAGTYTGVLVTSRPSGASLLDTLFPQPKLDRSPSGGATAAGVRLYRLIRSNN